MAVQRHPIDSYDTKLNFWEEFPDYKAQKFFGHFWAENKAAGNLKASSTFMWLLTLCYDRKSSFFSQPELDKWETASDDLFNDSEFMLKLQEDLFSVDALVFTEGDTLSGIIAMFESTLDSPIGAVLRTLEKKLLERTKYMEDTKYSSGTAEQLDKMFERTDKIAGLILKAMDTLKTSVGQGTTKGGQKESLSDGDKTF